MRVKALQDRCVTKEGVITEVKKHNTNLMNEQDQYKEALHSLNGELKETKEKFEEAGRQKEMLQGELSTLHEQVEKVGADVVKGFKASQSFINSCAEYYGTGFEDCLKQVVFSYPALDLSRITMDDPMPSTLAGDTIVGESDDSIESDFPPKDDGIVLAQPAGDPPVTTSKPSIELLDMENPPARDKNDKTLSDAPAT